MIKYLSIENFHSIKDENIVEFDINISNSYFHAHPTIGFAGANASGKTNFIKGLNFIVWFIGQSFFTKSSKIPFAKFIGSENLSTKFNFIFCIEQEVFEYELEINGNKVLNEILSGNSEMVYERTLKDVKFGKNITAFSTKDLKDTSSVISYATNFNSHTIAQKIRQYFALIETNVDSGGLDTVQFSAENLTILSQNELLKSKAVEIIRLADIGITDFFTDYNNVLDISSAFFKHKIGRSLTDFSEEKESSGTLQFFALISMILPKLETGGLVVLDEIEIKLHQNLVAYLIGLFQNPEVNKGSAQLIFTFHNSLFMDILAPEQLWFAEKNNKGETELFCAANFVDIEEIHKKSLEKLYRIGRFGAKPKGI